MIESEQVQDGGVEVVDVNFVFDGFVAVFIGDSVGKSAFHTAAAHHIMARSIWLRSSP